MPRKHLVASQTNKKQQQQAKVWQKLSKEIKAAVKVGGPNPDANPRLKAAIDKALHNNLSRESIQRNINGNNKDANNLETVQFECYGPNGMQIIVDAVTDNQNRTISNLRTYLAKLNGQIAKPNSVKVFFNLFGVIVIYKSDSYCYDSILELLLENKVEDLLEYEDSYELLCEPSDFYNIKNILLENDIKIFEAEIKYVSNEKIEVEDEEINRKIDRFLDSCDDDDDIQKVVTNFE